MSKSSRTLFTLQRKVACCLLYNRMSVSDERWLTFRYGDPNCEGERCMEPRKEVVTLEEYRERYATYHLDEGLQNIRRSAPLISAWDDHEVANDNAADGAQNHQPDTEGSWEDRVGAARQAYLEWMPFRVSSAADLEGSAGLPPQTFQFGDLMTFVTVDTRIAARSLEPTLYYAEQGGALGQYTPARTNRDTSKYPRSPSTAYSRIYPTASSTGSSTRAIP